MFLQIVYMVLLESLQGVTPLSAQLLQFDYLQNYTESATPRVEDHLTLYKTISLTSPLFRQKEMVSPVKQQHEFGEDSHHRVRRDVPTTSYSRPGSDDDGLRVGLPDGGDHPHIPHQANKTKPDKEELNVDGSFTRNFQTDNGINSKMSGYQKLLPSGEKGQAMQGQYSYTAPDGSTVSTSWIADEKGFRAQGPHISVFGLGFGRRR